MLDGRFDLKSRSQAMPSHSCHDWGRLGIDVCLELPIQYGFKYLQALAELVLKNVPSMSSSNLASTGSSFRLAQ